jgi:lipopolysaccharide transport system ATP-binding protein
MPTDTVIVVEGLSKRYRLGHTSRHDTLRDALSHNLKRLPRLLRGARPGPPDGNSEDFWALRDVSFGVRRGEVVGIIGRNGAGKSTLLKILSRITEPTAGRVALQGRVVSLLEVGTGFHPELTGRENVFLNGAILGMKRAEISRKFDEIVSFAEVEQFLDTPVKHYSSGMYVRLAFAVAAHLEPEILIVDEVLAVGDMEFQRKCLGKMEQVAGGGRTVLFVSHNMAAVQRLCGRGLHLRQGRLVSGGPVEAVIDSYLTEATASGSDRPPTYAKRCAALEIEKAEILVNGEVRSTVPAGSTATFRLRYRCREPARFPDGLECGFIVYGHGQKLANFWSNAGLGRTLMPVPRGIITCTVPDWPFRTMPMSLQVHLNYRRETLVDLPEAVIFDSLDSDRFGTGIVPSVGEGIVLLPHRWESTDGAPT